MRLLVEVLFAAGIVISFVLGAVIAELNERSRETERIRRSRKR